MKSEKLNKMITFVEFERLTMIIRKFIVPAFLMCLLFACKSGNVVGESTPFTEKKYASDSLYLRVAGLGESTILSTARTISLHDAQAKMAMLLQTSAKSLARQYTKHYVMTEDLRTAVKFEETLEQSANSLLIDMKIVDEKYFRDSQGKYQYWILLEMKKEELFSWFQSTSSAAPEL